MSVYFITVGKNIQKIFFQWLRYFKKEFIWEIKNNYVIYWSIELTGCRNLRVRKVSNNNPLHQQTSNRVPRYAGNTRRLNWRVVWLTSASDDFFSKLCSTSQHICWLVELINNDVNLLFCLMLCFGVVSVLFLSLYNNHWYLHRHIYLNNNFCLPVDVENQFRTALLLNIF